jgi:carbon-monoxide dehydrogenase medium subunit
MYPDEFDYHAPDTVEGAIDLLGDHDDATILAGGHSLLPTMKAGLSSPDVVVDIGDIEDIHGIEVGEDATTIGAATTYSELVDAGLDNLAPFPEAVGVVGDRQVRNRGTVGGNLAHADPGADPPGAALAADATIHVTGPDGDRTVDAEDFFIATYTTDLGEREVLTAVEIPHTDAGDAGAYVKKKSPSSGYAMVGVAVQLRVDGGDVEAARVGVNGALTVAQRLGPVEDELEGAALDDSEIAAEAASRATEGLESWDLMDDEQASGEFRAHLLEVYAEDAIETALERAGD